MPTTFGLLFLPSHGADNQPVAHVHLNTTLTHAYAELEPAQPLVTPAASTVAELNYQITRLHEELENLREDARSKFAEASQPSRSTNGSGS